MCCDLNLICFVLQCLLMILRHAHTTGTGALLLRTAGIIPTATVATAGLVFTEMGKTVLQKVSFNTVFHFYVNRNKVTNSFFVTQESPRE